jgi:large subunit ribosomal protein L18
MASKTNPRTVARLKRKQRVRKRVQGISERPRLCVFRSDKHIYAQIIDDVHGVTLVSASTLAPEFKQMEAVQGKVGAAQSVGRMIAGKAKNQGITKVVFDRNGYIYHGRIRALADSAREAGLEF